MADTIKRRRVALRGPRFDLTRPAGNTTTGARLYSGGWKDSTPPRCFLVSEWTSHRFHIALLAVYTAPSASVKGKYKKTLPALLVVKMVQTVQGSGAGHG